MNKSLASSQVITDAIGNRNERNNKQSSLSEINKKQVLNLSYKDFQRIDKEVLFRENGIKV